MTRAALAAVVIALTAAGVEMMLAWGILGRWFPPAVLAQWFAFLAGSLVFLALMAWRRRTHRTRSRLLLCVAAAVGVAGVAVLGRDYYLLVVRPTEDATRHPNPALLPLVQWVVVLVVWVGLVIQEAREKRATPAAKKSP
jgi:hypothetical protein